MTYLLQLLTLLVGVASHFFECVKKDHEKRIVTKGRIPIPTGAGVMLLLLLIFSFIGSVISTWHDTAKADKDKQDLNNELTKLRAQNSVLEQKTDGLTKQNSDLKESLVKLAIDNQDQFDKAAHNIKQASSVLLNTMQSDVIETSYLRFVMVLNGSPPRNGDLSSLLKALDSPSDEGLKNLMCSDSEKLDEIELRILISFAPRLEFVIGRTMIPTGCFVSIWMEATDRMGTKHKIEPPVPAITSLSGGRIAIRSAITDSALKSDAFLEPLHANTFGPWRSARFYLSAPARYAELLETKAMENRAPKSITVYVSGWTNLYPSPVSIPKPTFERAWYLPRLGIFGDGDGAHFSYGDGFYDYPEEPE